VRTLIAFAIVFGAGIGLPVLALFNCSGWNEGSMRVATCIVDTPALRDWAEILYGFLLLASFMGGIPLLIYLVMLIAVALFIRWSLPKKPR
jgi:hypothetical protein